MIAIVTNYGDFDIAIIFKEFDHWCEEAPIEEVFFKEGEVPCGNELPRGKPRGINPKTD